MENNAGVDNFTLSYNTAGAFNSGATVTDGENAITISGANTGFWLTGITRGHYVNWKIRANNKNGSSGWSSTLINQPTLDFQAQLLDPIASGGICKIKADRTGVVCQGRNNLNQIDNTGSIKTTPTLVANSSDAVTLGNGSNVTAWVNSDNTYFARGYDQGNGTFQTSITGVTNPQAVKHENEFVLFLNSDDTVRSLGEGLYGRLGYGSETDQTSNSVGVSGLTGVDRIEAGQWHGLALLSNGQIWAWGANNFGEVGDGTVTNRLSPVKTDLTSDTAVDLRSGGRGNVAVLSDGTVNVWGKNSNATSKMQHEHEQRTNPTHS